jgi:hypothetical protein
MVLLGLGEAIAVGRWVMIPLFADHPQSLFLVISLIGVKSVLVIIIALGLELMGQFGLGVGIDVVNWVMGR